MKQGNVTYKDFRFERGSGARRTERAQRQEITEHLDTLTAQGDFWSLDTIRRLAKELIDDESPERADRIYSAVEKLIRVEHGVIVW